MLQVAKHLTKSRSLVSSLVFRRGARTRSQPVIKQKPVNPEVIKLNEEYQNNLKTEFAKRGLEKLNVDKDLFFFDILNTSKPGSFTDKRFKNGKLEFAKLENDDDKIKYLTEFLINEIKYEIFEFDQYQNDMQINENENLDFEKLTEFEFKQLFINSNDDKEYLKFKILTEIMSNLLNKRGGLLIISPEVLVEIFKLSQFIIDNEELKLKIRYLSGKLIYNLKKFEFDYLSESQFIESLILNKEYLYAKELLNKRKIDQRFWIELKIVNELELNNLKVAEDLVLSIYNQSNSKYLDLRIFELFIDKYSETNDFENLNRWISNYKDLIIKNNGFNNETDDTPMFNLEEDEVLKLLNEEKLPTNLNFLKIIEILIKDLNEENVELISGLLKFYLNYEDSNDLIDLLNTYKYSIITKLIPNIPENDELNEFFKNYFRQLNLKSNDLDTFKILSNNKNKKNKNLKKILNEIEKIIELEGKLSSSVTYYLLQSFLRNGKIEESFEILKKMEKVTDQDDEILPKIESKHYLPFLSYYGKLGNYQEFRSILNKFGDESPDFKLNPIILTQILNSLNKMKKYSDLIELINKILIENIHEMDKNYVKSSKFNERKFYSTIWKCIKDTLLFIKQTPKANDINSKRVNNLINNFPNLRLLFMRMIYNNVLPNSDDYYLIFSSFFLNREKYSNLCVLKYYNEKHNLKLTNQIIKIFNRYNLNIMDDEINVNYDPNQSKILNELHLKPKIGSNLDPFAEPVQQELKFDLSDETEASRERQKETQDSNYQYFLTIKSIIKQNKKFDLKYSTKVFNDFELLPPNQSDLIELYKKYNDVYKT